MLVLNDRDHDHLYKDLYLRDEAPPHPGEILRDDILPALGLSRAAMARALGVSARKLGLLLAEQEPVTCEVAMRLSAALGHGARYWLGLQMQYDLWRIEQPSELKVKRLAWVKGSGVKEAIRNKDAGTQIVSSKSTGQKSSLPKQSAKSAEGVRRASSYR